MRLCQKKKGWGDDNKENFPNLQKKTIRSFREWPLTRSYRIFHYTASFQRTLVIWSKAKRRIFYEIRRTGRAYKAGQQLATAKFTVRIGDSERHEYAKQSRADWTCIQNALLTRTSYGSGSLQMTSSSACIQVPACCWGQNNYGGPAFQAVLPSSNKPLYLIFPGYVPRKRDVSSCLHDYISRLR